MFQPPGSLLTLQSSEKVWLFSRREILELPKHKKVIALSPSRTIVDVSGDMIFFVSYAHNMRMNSSLFLVRLMMRSELAAHKMWLSSHSGKYKRHLFNLLMVKIPCCYGLEQAKCFFFYCYILDSTNHNNNKTSMTFWKLYIVLYAHSILLLRKNKNHKTSQIK